MVLRLLGAAAGLLLAGCVTRAPVVPATPVPVPPVAAVPFRSARSRVRSGNAAGVRWLRPRGRCAQAARALGAFGFHAGAVRRRDSSGLTSPADWQALCGRPCGDPALSADFFRDRSTGRRAGSLRDRLLRTEIRGSSTPASALRCRSIARRPTSSAHARRWRHRRGRIDETGQCVFYYTRAEIEAGRWPGAGSRSLCRRRSTCSPPDPGIGASDPA